MKKVDESIINTLKGNIAFLFNRINELDVNLSLDETKIQRYNDLVACAYYLSSIYSCLEDAFLNIAKVFENRIENPASWHKEILNRMIIAVPNIRSAVINKNNFMILDELRRFRHVFRSSYVFTLDKENFLLIVKKWKVNKENIFSEINKFLENI